MIVYGKKNFYFLRPENPSCHRSCVKSASALGFIAFLLFSLVLPTRRCSLITRSAHSLSCMAGLCLPHAHSLSLSGRLGIRTPPDWGSIQTFEILSSNCLWLARCVKTVAVNAACGPPFVNDNKTMKAALMGVKSQLFHVFDRNRIDIDSRTNSQSVLRKRTRQLMIWYLMRVRKTDDADLQNIFVLPQLSEFGEVVPTFPSASCLLFFFSHSFQKLCNYEKPLTLSPMLLLKVFVLLPHQQQQWWVEHILNDFSN